MTLTVVRALMMSNILFALMHGTSPVCVLQWPLPFCLYTFHLMTEHSICNQEKHQKHLSPYDCNPVCLRNTVETTFHASTDTKRGEKCPEGLLQMQDDAGDAAGTV